MSPTHLPAPPILLPTAKEDFPKHSQAPMMRAEKLENLQICLRFLQQHHHVQLDGVQAEGNPTCSNKGSLLVCNQLYDLHYGFTE